MSHTIEYKGSLFAYSQIENKHYKGKVQSSMLLQILFSFGVVVLLRRDFKKKKKKKNASTYYGRELCEETKHNYLE